MIQPEKKWEIKKEIVGLNEIISFKVYILES